MTLMLFMFSDAGLYQYMYFIPLPRKTIRLFLSRKWTIMDTFSSTFHACLWRDSSRQSEYICMTCTQQLNTYTLINFRRPFQVRGGATEKACELLLNS